MRVEIDFVVRAESRSVYIPGAISITLSPETFFFFRDRRVPCVRRECASVVGSSPKREQESDRLWLHAGTWN